MAWAAALWAVAAQAVGTVAAVVVGTLAAVVVGVVLAADLDLDRLAAAAADQAVVTAGRQAAAAWEAFAVSRFVYIHMCFKKLGWNKDVDVCVCICRVLSLCELDVCKVPSDPTWTRRWLHAACCAFIASVADS